jgi:hypothetical protein
VKHGWLRRVEGAGKGVAYASQQLTLVNRQNVAVAWSTTWEINLKRFQLERRPETGGEYAVVEGKEVLANGTTMTPHPYGLTDNSVPAGGWWYRVVGISSDGTRYPSDPSFIRVPIAVVVGVQDSPIPIVENFPNPFNPTTEIRFSIPGAGAGEARTEVDMNGWVTLKVYDILGREVASLVDEKKEPGTYYVTFNAAGLASGVYVYRLNAGGTTLTRRMLLTK